MFLLPACGTTAARTLDSTIPQPIAETASISLVELEAAFVDFEMTLTQRVNLAVSDEPAYLYELDGNIALDRWADLRALTNETGYYPVLLGSTEPFDPFDTGQFETDWQYVVENAADSAFLQEAEDFDVDTWRQRRLADSFIGATNLEIGPELSDYDGPKDIFIAHVNLFENRPHKRVMMVLVPTTSPWEVASLLRLGGFNDSPLPEEHEGLHKLWFDEFGAEIVSASSDQIEMTVARPPTTDAAAIEIGIEHYLYAPDLVWEGTQDVAVLASSLVDNSSWYFWWD